MQPLIDTLAEDPGLLIAAIAIIAVFSIVALAITFGVTHSIARTRAQERTRREIAAYVAEGTMTAEDAAAILITQRSSEEIEEISAAVKAAAKATRNSDGIPAFVAALGIGCGSKR